MGNIECSVESAIFTTVKYYRAELNRIKNPDRTRRAIAAMVRRMRAYQQEVNSGQIELLSRPKLEQQIPPLDGGRNRRTLCLQRLHHDLQRILEETRLEDRIQAHGPTNRHNANRTSLRPSTPLCPKTQIRGVHLTATGTAIGRNFRNGK
jgi:hypothetical protein